MDSLEYIDNYFKGNFPPEETRQFEKRIEEEPEFAEEVAFYLSARQVAHEQLTEEKKVRFKEIYLQEPYQPNASPVRKLWRYAAAAAVVAAIFFGGYFYLQPSSTKQLASEYIERNFDKMGVEMSSVQDSLNLGKSLYDDRNYTKALQVFGLIIQNNPADVNFEAKKNAGIASLKLKDYDKALMYFKELEKFTARSNPGKFYQALTLMERNKPGDRQEAERLLRVVVNEEQEGKDVARKWLKQF